MQTSHVRQIKKKKITEYKIDDLLSLVDRHEDWIDKNCLNLYAASNILNTFHIDLTIIFRVHIFPTREIFDKLSGQSPITWYEL